MNEAEERELEYIEKRLENLEHTIYLIKAALL